MLPEAQNAQVRLHLRRAPLAFDGVEAGMQPLGLPDVLNASFEKLASHVVKSLAGDLNVTLQSGRHAIPLVGQRPGRVRIAEDCQVRLSLQVVEAPTAESGSGPVLSRLRCEISPPIVLENVLSTLDEVQQVFEDRFVRKVRDKVKGWRSLGRVAALEEKVHYLMRQRESSAGALTLPMALLKRSLRRAEDTLDSLVDGVHLSAVHGRPVQRPDGWHLQLHFSGEVVLGGRLRVPFSELRLTEFILPSIKANVDGLLGLDPLASGKFLGERLQRSPLAKALSHLWKQVSGEVNLTLQMPNTVVQTGVFDGGEVGLRLAAQAPARLFARVAGSQEGGEVRLEADGVWSQTEAHKVLYELSAVADTAAMLSFLLDAPAKRALRLRVPHRAGVAPAAPALRARIELRPGSTLESAQVGLSYVHPLAKGESNVDFEAYDLRLGGSLELSFVADEAVVYPEALSLSCEGQVRARPHGVITTGASQIAIQQVNGTLSGRCQWQRGQDLVVRGESDFDVVARATTHIGYFPELGIHEPHLGSVFETRGHLDLRLEVTEEGQRGLLLRLNGSLLELSLQAAELNLGPRRIVVPAGTLLGLQVEEAELSTSGLGGAVLALGWDCQGQVPLIYVDRRAVALVTRELAQRVLELRIDASGGLRFAGEAEGLFDARFFNALVNPLGEPEKWRELLDNMDALSFVYPVIGVFSPEAERVVRRLADVAVRARAVLEAEGIHQPGDLIPRQKMAQVLSLLLVESDALAPRLAVIIEGVTEARGLDRREVEAILSEVFPEHGHAFEIERLLRWLDHVLSPMVLAPPRVQEVVALVDDEAFREVVAPLPSAMDLYEVGRGRREAGKGRLERIVAVASGFSLAQIQWFLRAAPVSCTPAQRARLSYLVELKERVALIARGYGGIGYQLQAVAIAFYLGNVLAADEAARRGRSAAGRSGYFDGLLAPADVAVLLQAGLTAAHYSRLVQINLHLLVRFMAARGEAYTLAVFSEMGMDSPRVLTSALLAFLNQDQDCLRQSTDRAAFLSEMLHVEIPRRSDYMAGGRRARESYYQALAHLAEQIIEKARPYQACKLHLQQARHLVLVRVATAPQRIEDEARQAVAYADQVGLSCGFQPASGPLDVAERAYRAAFAACARLQRVDRHAFQRDWFRAFWSRNHEALVVRSVVRNYQAGVDEVPYWLHTRLGREEKFRNEQELLEGVVRALYYYPKDVTTLLRDPLVRLLLDPPARRLRFTVVSGMGVVTDGMRGREFEASFARLAETYGVGVVRSDTGTAKPLTYNAAKIIEAVRRVEGPYGLLGYSQGAANVLMAESLLRAGTPDEQALLDGLVTRNFLFSALNGSAHGSCGQEKFMRAMVEGEAFLKHYQGITSANFIRLVTRAINSVLDSPYVTHVMGSVESLSYEGVTALARDGQFLDHVPTATVRGVVEEAVLPEALEFLSHVFQRQVGTPLHDTQVTLDSAVGHSVWLRNANTEVLERCDMGSMAQICHHWSPLLHDTAFITTPRDVARAIYAFPKDRHLFPWVEVNARFGLIEEEGAD